MILDFSQPIILEPAPSSRSNTTIEYQKEQYPTCIMVFNSFVGMIPSKLPNHIYLKFLREFSNKCL